MQQLSARRSWRYLLDKAGKERLSNGRKVFLPERQKMPAGEQLAALMRF